MPSTAIGDNAKAKDVILSANLQNEDQRPNFMCGYIPTVAVLRLSLLGILCEACGMSILPVL